MMRSALALSSDLDPSNFHSKQVQKIAKPPTLKQDCARAIQAKPKRAKWLKDAPDMCGQCQKPVTEHTAPVRARKSLNHF
jgi:hypothetical protein